MKKQIKIRPDVGAEKEKCSRCKRKLGYPFFGLKDTFDLKTEKLLCKKCGDSFVKWWKRGKSK